MLKDVGLDTLRELAKLRPVKKLLRVTGLQDVLAGSRIYPEWEWRLRQEMQQSRSATPNWQEHLARGAEMWSQARRAATQGPKVLIATSVSGFQPLTVIESMLAVALTLREAQVHLLVCDEHLPACLLSNIREFQDTKEFAERGPYRHLCWECHADGEKLFGALELPIHRHSDLITETELKAARVLAASLPVKEIPQYQQDGISIGEHAVAGTVRYFIASNWEDEPQGEAILRRYFLGALLSMYEFRRLLQDQGFSSVCFNHGVYVPYGLFGEVARRLKVPLMTWAPAYRKQTFVFSHGDTYHHTLMSEPTSVWEEMPWTGEMETEIVDYLKSRWTGTRDWITYQTSADDDLSCLVKDFGLDLSKPCIGMLTNVIWDAQVHYPANAFPNTIDWVIQTIRYFATRQDLQLVIRIHPAEVHHGHRSRQPMKTEIDKAFPSLPKNVFIVPPERAMNTYAAMMQCDAVLIYGTKTGVELTSMGIPVIVAGEAWIRNKGITWDANSPQEYFDFLDRLPLKERLSEAVIQRARKYAYHFFFRRMIPLPFMKLPHPYSLEISGLEDLMPGKSLGLDTICDGVLRGHPFVYPAEERKEVIDEGAAIDPRRRGYAASRAGAI